MNIGMMVLLISSILYRVNGQLYEDKRCRCVCPSPAAVLTNVSNSDRILYIANVAPTKCDCDNVILPQVSAEIREHVQEYCPRCQCRYEERNTTIIKVVVIIVVWVITLLLVYMGFLICLNPFINRRRVKMYQELSPEEAQNLLQGEED